MAAVVLAILLDHALIGAEIAKPGFKNTDPRPVHRLSAHTEDGPDRWVIALDEVAWSDGGRPVRFERIPDQTSLAALRGWMAVAESTIGPAPSLVLYDESGNDSDMSRAVATREVVVTLSRGTSPQSVALALGAEYKGELAYAPGTHRFLAVTALEALNAAETLYKHAGIVAVRPQIARWREPTAVPDDPLYKDQWHLRNTGQADGPNDLDLNVESAWDTVRGRGVVIGIVDSGLIADHPDLSTNVQEDLGYDFRDGDDDPSPFLGMPNQQDPQNEPQEDSHGTLVAGVAAGRGFNGIGATGVAPEAGIADIRLIGDYLTDVQEADAIHHRNDVIAIKNNSWGPRDNGAALSGPDELATAALLDAVTNGRGGLGTILVWSGGNGGRDNDNANKNGFANSIYTIAVGALNDQGKRAIFSEIGSNLLVTAPVGARRGFGAVTTDLFGDDGLNISGYQTDLDDPAYTQNFFGTSASAPMVSGVVALMLEANPGLGWRDVQEIFVRSSSQVDASAATWLTNAAGFSFSDEYGAGLADATAAVTMARTWVNLGPQRASARNLQLEEPIEIPDAGAPPLEHNFSFEGTNLRVEQATVRVFVEHSARGEIAVELESPSGTVSQLVGRNDDDSRGYFDWTFSSVQFWGENAGGNWKLRIVDGVAGNSGQLWQATVTLHGTETTADNLPATPHNLTAVGANTNAISLDWEDLAINETAYRVEISPAWGSPWIVVTDLPANTSHFELGFLPQGRDIYFRVVALRNTQQSGYSNTAHGYTEDGDGAVLLQTGFEPAEGFSVNTTLNGINGWEAFPAEFDYPAQGIEADAFTSRGRPGHGQQAYVGKTWIGGSDSSSIIHSTFLDPPPNTTIRMTALVCMTSSTNGASDGFGFDFFNKDGNILCKVLFDNGSGAILHASASNNSFNTSSATFTKEIVYDLEVTLNFATDQWSAKLGSRTIVSNADLIGAGSSIQADLGGFGAFWQIPNTSTPGNNAMLFDDVLITQIGTSPPDTPSEFEGESVGSSIIYLTWAQDLMAEQYEIQRSPDGLDNWASIATTAEDKSFYIDPFLTPNTFYYYKMRALSGVGDSAFSETINVRTYSQYEAWKDGHRIATDAPEDEDSDDDKIPLFLEYALDLNPRHVSTGGLPRVDYADGQVILRYFRARNDLQYQVEESADLNTWSPVGVVQEADVLGLFISAALDLPASGRHFLRLVVSE
jgi:subtilisin-like proprotein convertase family protein